MKCLKNISISMCDYLGMLTVLKTGILLLLITLGFGRSFTNEDKVNVTIYNENPLENNCNCEWRYLQHYEAKGCQIVQVDSCECPQKYVCPLSGDANEEQKICIYQNQEYKLGSRINVTDKCQSCRCLGGEHPQIICRHKECPQLDSAGDKNCHLVYEKDQCCPSKYECVTKTSENEAIEEDFFCVHNGVTYPMGAKIYPSDDPCLICECSKDWRGVSNSSCYQQNCLFEKNKKMIDEGCVPVYHENKCCPIELFCPESNNLRSNNLPIKIDLIKENSETYGSNCLFGGNTYEIGTELSLKNPCIKCNCSVPPDFTCIHQSCPPPPSVENCEVVVLTNYCCPSYKCLYEDKPVTNHNSSEIECPTPICADATCVIIIPEGHQCPTCICNESMSHEKNIFESTDDLIIEGSLKNGSSVSESEELENENFEAEVLNDTQLEFINRNSNVSEKFVDDSSEIENIKVYELEHSENEGVKRSSVKEGNQTSEDSREYFHEELDEESERSNNVSLTIEDKHDLIKILRKRSNDFRNLNNAQQQQNSIQYNQFTQNQQQFFEEDNTESDREILEDSDEGFDELKISTTNREESRIDHEDLFGSESSMVPAGCPTPLCDNSSCKIKIPIGHRCPTCVCRNREAWQP